jgi:hypothetical protein
MVWEFIGMKKISLSILIVLILSDVAISDSYSNKEYYKQLDNQRYYNQEYYKQLDNQQYYKKEYYKQLDNQRYYNQEYYKRQYYDRRSQEEQREATSAQLQREGQEILSRLKNLRNNDEVEKARLMQLLKHNRNMQIINAISY